MLLIPKSAGLYWSQYVMIVMLFLDGVINFSGTIAGYQLFCDYAPERRHAIMGSLWNIGEGACVIWCTLYYMFISKDWSWLIWAVTGIHILLGSIVALFLTESPAWLYTNQKYKDCYDVLKYMG